MATWFPSSDPHALYWNKKLRLQQHSTPRLAPTPTHLALCCQGCLSNLKIRHNPPFIYNPLLAPITLG